MDNQIASEPVAPKKRELRALKRLALIAAQRERKMKQMREKYEREIQLGRKSLWRLKDRCEEICGRFAEEELREEIELWSNNVEKLIERKDEKINTLIFRLEEIYETEMRREAMYMDQLKYLSRCHRALLQSALDIFDLHKGKIVQDFVLMVNDKRDYQAKCNRTFENSAYARNEVDKLILKGNYENYMDEKFDDVCHEVETRYRLQESTVEKMRCLQDQLLSFLKRLEGDNLDVNKNQRFLFHMRKKRKVENVSARLDAAENTCKRRIMDLKQELLNLEMESNAKLNGLQLELGYFTGIKSTINGFMERNKLATQDKLMCDTSESYNTIKKLQKIVKNGELLLSMVANCRKYESDLEKVLPFKDIDPFENINTKLDMTTLDMKKFFHMSEEELIYQMKYMSKFWNRSSKVNYHNIMLRQDKKELLEQNEEYLHIIRSMRKSGDPKYIMESLNVEPIKLNHV